MAGYAPRDVQVARSFDMGPARCNANRKREAGCCQPASGLPLSANSRSRRALSLLRLRRLCRLAKGDGVRLIAARRARGVVEVVPAVAHDPSIGPRVIHAETSLRGE